MARLAGQQTWSLFSASARTARRDAQIGAAHGFTPCTNCAAPPGSYNNSVKNLFDYVRDWDQ